MALNDTYLISFDYFQEVYYGNEYIILIDKNDTPFKSTQKTITGLNNVPLRDYYSRISGGIEFFNRNDLLLALKFGFNSLYYREVTLVVDSTIYCDSNSFITDKVILSEKKLISDMIEWENEAFCNEALKSRSDNFKYIKNIPEDVLFNIIQTNPSLVKEIQNPTQEMMTFALSKYPYLISHFNDPPSDMVINVLSKYPYNVNSMKRINISDLCRIIKINPDVAKYIPEIYKKLYRIENYQGEKKIHPFDISMRELAKLLIHNNIACFPYINKEYQTENMVMAALNHNSEYVKYVNDSLFTESVCIKMIEENSHSIKNIKNPTRLMWRTAIEKDCHSVLHIQNPTDEMYLFAASKCAKYYVYINNLAIIPDEITDEYILSQCPEYIERLEDPTLEQWNFVMNHNPKLFKFMHEKYHTTEMCFRTIPKYPEALKYISSQTYEMCLLGVFVNGKMIKYVNDEIKNSDKYENLCYCAIDNDYMAIKYIDNQTDNIIKYSLHKNKKSFKYLKNQSYELCIEIVKKDYNLAKYINDITPELCLDLIKIDYRIMKFLNKLPQCLYVSCVAVDYRCIDYIQNVYVKNYCQTVINDLKGEFGI